VLPTTIPQQTHASLTPHGDHTVRVQSANAPQSHADPHDATRGTDRRDTVEADKRSDRRADWRQYTLGEEHATGTWLDYIQGLTWALRDAGYALGSGFDLEITSDVPLGAGLSSSASLEVAVLRSIRQAFTLDLDDVKLALLGQRAENDFVGARCGIMDQMAASLADASSALFLDTRSLEYRRVPLPADADLVVIHSGVEHELSGGDYNTRRAECEEAAHRLGVPQLRDLDLTGLGRLELLPDPLRRRARHVITENARVLEAIEAMQSNDLIRLGQLFAESHASMRDDFEVSVPDVDFLVELAQAHNDVFGARLTGGGFGGSAVILARRGTGRLVAEQVAHLYAERSRRKPTVLVPPLIKK
jgi:galactokinase